MDQLRVMGRATQGVKLIRVGEGDEISSVEKISREEEEELEDPTSPDLENQTPESPEETTE